MPRHIGLGTWPLGGVAYGPVPEAEALAVIAEALQLGVRFFDTADIYGDGRAERLLGRVLSDSEEVRLVTKAGYLNEAGGGQDFSPTHLERSLEGSLKRLRRDSIEGFMLHSPPGEVISDSAVQACLGRMVTQGRVRRLGVSVRSWTDAEAVLAWKDYTFVELIYNLLDQRPLDSRLLDRCAARGVDVIARVPLCFGLLTEKYRPGHRFPSGDQRARWPREQTDRWLKGVEAFHFLVRPDRSMSQAALAFCVDHPAVRWTIPGMKSREQVRHNTVAADPSRRLTAEELRRVRRCWRELRHLPPR